MELTRLNCEDELTKFYSENCMKDDFLRYLFDECNKRLITFVDSGTNYDFDVFMECEIIFRNYFTYKYNLDICSIDLSNYFFKSNNLDISDYIYRDYK